MGVIRPTAQPQAAQKKSPLESWMEMWPWMQSQERAASRTMMRQLQEQIQSQGRGMVTDLSKFRTDWTATPETVRQTANLLKNAYPAMRGKLDKLDPASVLPTQRAKELEGVRRAGAAERERLLGDPYLAEQIAADLGLHVGDVGLTSRSGIPQAIGLDQPEGQTTSGGGLLSPFEWEQPPIAPLGKQTTPFFPSPAVQDIQRAIDVRKAGMSAEREWDIGTLKMEEQAKLDVAEPFKIAQDARTYRDNFYLAEWARLFTQVENTKDRALQQLLLELREQGLNARQTRDILAREHEGIQNRAQDEIESIRDMQTGMAEHVTSTIRSIEPSLTKTNVSTTVDRFLPTADGGQIFIPANALGTELYNKEGNLLRWIPEGALSESMRTQMAQNWESEGARFSQNNPDPEFGTLPNPEVWIPDLDRDGQPTGAGKMGRFYDAEYQATRPDTVTGGPNYQHDWNGPKIFNVSPSELKEYIEDMYGLEMGTVKEMEQSGLGWVLGAGVIGGGVDLAVPDATQHPLGIPRRLGSGGLGADPFLRQYQQRSGRGF